MSPLREFRSFTTRFEEDIKIEPLRRYYLIFEGANTERKYFQGIDNNRKELGINNYIELVILHKEGDISSFSHPVKLLELIEEKKKTLKRDGNFDKDIDKFVIVFDRDSYEKEEDYIEFIKKASNNNILTVTSPCFEIWLILHYEDAVENYILSNKDLFENKKVSSSHTCASRLFSEISGTNPKSGAFFNKLKANINLAIEQEKLLQQDILKMSSEVGSNVGNLIEQMREDPRNSI